MKAKKYNLQTVLNIRGRSREQAARLVAHCLERVAQAENELLARRQRLSSCREKQEHARSQLESELETGAQARGIVPHRVFLKDLREQEIELSAAVEEQNLIVREAKHEFEAARRKLAEATRQLQAVEKHKENWLRAERIEENRKDRKIGDEIGSILHNRRGNT